MSTDRQIAGSRHADVQDHNLLRPGLSDHASHRAQDNTRRETTHLHALHLVSEPANAACHDIVDPTLNAAMCELERLVVDARRAISNRHRFPALSSLVAIQPLVSHLLDGCNEKLNTTEPHQNDQTDEPAGYL